MKLKWEQMVDDNIHMLFMSPDDREKDEDVIAAAIKKSEKEWVIAVEGRTGSNKIVEADSSETAKSLCELLIIDVMQHEIDAREKLINEVKTLNSLRDDDTQD